MKVALNSQLGGQPEVSSAPKGSFVPVVLALTALAGLAYYLYRHFALSVEAQKIRNDFKNPPKSLSNLDLYYLAKKVESLLGQRLQPSERFKVEVFSDFFNPMRRKKFIVSLGQNNTVRIQYIDTTLGRGGFGKVVRLVDLDTGQKTALKVAKSPKRLRPREAYLERAQEDLKKEHQNLMIVHQSKYKPLGVQDKPLTPILKIIKVYRYVTKVSMGYEGSLYDGSLDKLRMLSVPLKTRLRIAYQVLQGMETLLANKLISHDLKPQNLLYRIDQESLVVHISDLGGVTHEDQLEKELDKGLACTPQYADVSRLSFATVVPINFFKKSLVRSSEKCAIGLTIFWVLTGHVPTDERSFEAIWHTARLPFDGKFKELFSALKKSSDTGFFSSFFKDNIHELKVKVEALSNS